MENSQKNFISSVLFLIGVPLLAHFSFSWMGFCPTYEGLNLAFSRRILDGQIPHRDFINIRPVGSALLYAPFAVFGGNATFWICRLFVWFEFACIAWIWTSMILRSAEISIPPFQKFLIASVAFMFTTHTFPAAAWYTIDGFFFLSIGLLLCVERPPKQRLLGYVILGLAYLCKQTFLLIFPAVFLILGDWRHKRFWFAAAGPGVVYTLYLLSVRAVPDAVLQLGSHANALFPRGIAAYFKELRTPAGILLGFLAAHFLFGGGTTRQKAVGAFLLAGLMGIFAVSFNQKDRMTSLLLSFALFGTVFGMNIYLILKKKLRPSFVRIGLLTLLSGWAVSLSLTYSFPIFAAGPFMVLLTVYNLKAFEPLTAKNQRIKKYFYVLLIFFFVVSLWNYAKARRRHVYRNQSVGKLSRSLGEVLPGGRLIWISPETYRFLADFRKIRGMAGEQRFAVLPGLPAYWAVSGEKNPLEIDWAIREETTYNKVLTERVIRKLDSQRGKITVLLMKENAARLKQGLIELPVNEIYQRVKERFRKEGETEFFELYR